MNIKGIHVVTNPSGGWSVKRSGATRASRKFLTQKEAINFARTSAKKEAGELYIHAESGKVRERNSYGQNPVPH